MHNFRFFLSSIPLLSSSLIFCCAGEKSNTIIQDATLTEDTPRPRPMVFGLGPGRTGTDSLRKALVELGFGPTYHMREILFENEGISTEGHVELFHKAAVAVPVSNESEPLVDFRHILKEYNSGTDWPLSSFPDELLATFPDAKFILTKRSSRGWHRSIQSTICFFNPSRYPIKFLQYLPLGKPFSRMGGQGQMMDAIIKYKFAPGIASSWSEVCDSEQIAIDALEKWNDRVHTIIPPQQLFVFELGVHGYRELCQFLNVEEPSNYAYPRINSTKEMQIIIRSLWLLYIVVHVLITGVTAALIYNFLRNRHVTARNRMSYKKKE